MNKKNIFINHPYEIGKKRQYLSNNELKLLKIGENNMKLTKNKLREIIKEELEKLNENKKINDLSIDLEQNFIDLNKEIKKDNPKAWKDFKKIFGNAMDELNDFYEKHYLSS